MTKLFAAIALTFATAGAAFAAPAAPAPKHAVSAAKAAPAAAHAPAKAGAKPAAKPAAGKTKTVSGKIKTQYVGHLKKLPRHKGAHKATAKPAPGKK